MTVVRLLTPEREPPGPQTADMAVFTVTPVEAAFIMTIGGRKVETCSPFPVWLLEVRRSGVIEADSVFPTQAEAVACATAIMDDLKARGWFHDAICPS